MTKGEIIKDVLIREEEKEGDNQDEVSALQSVSHDATKDAFTTSIKWAEENNVFLF